MYINIIDIYLFDQNMGMAFMARFKCTHIPSVLIFLGEIRLSVVKSRSALSPLASCCWNIMIHHNDTYSTVLYLYTSFYLLRLEIIPLNLLKTKLNNDLLLLEYNNTYN